MQQYRSSSNDTHVILIKLSINNAVSTKYDVQNLAASLGARVGYVQVRVVYCLPGGRVILR